MISPDQKYAKDPKSVFLPGARFSRRMDENYGRDGNGDRSFPEINESIAAKKNWQCQEHRVLLSGRIGVFTWG
jgi:hypothetical protein